jgi:hypothetical protein
MHSIKQLKVESRDHNRHSGDRRGEGSQPRSVEGQVWAERAPPYVIHTLHKAPRDGTVAT